MPAQICRVFRVRSTGACAGIFSNNVLLVIADIILKRVANYIYIPIYSTISRIPTTLRYSPLLPVSENGRVEIITTDQSDAAFGLNPAEVSDFCKYPLANSPARAIRPMSHIFFYSYTFYKWDMPLMWTVLRLCVSFLAKTIQQIRDETRVQNKSSKNNHIVDSPCIPLMFTYILWP